MTSGPKAVSRSLTIRQEADGYTPRVNARSSYEVDFVATAAVHQSNSEAPQIHDDDGLFHRGRACERERLRQVQSREPTLHETG
eukprot:365219-Chlamydomonas_euryale.AAC.18